MPDPIKKSDYQTAREARPARNVSKIEIEPQPKDFASLVPADYPVSQDIEDKRENTANQIIGKMEKPMVKPKQ